jgi:hypothetical protein
MILIAALLEAFLNGAEYLEAPCGISQSPCDIHLCRTVGDGHLGGTNFTPAIAEESRVRERLG